MTIDYLLDTIYSELSSIFPDVRILDVGDKSTFRDRDFLQVEVPLVTYSVRFEPHLERVLDWVTEKDLDSYTATIDEEIPYRMHIWVGCHSDIEREADAMAQKLLRAWGFSPRLGTDPGFGCYLEAFDRTDVQDFGVASRIFHYIAWVRLEGREETAPLVRRIDYEVKPSCDQGWQSESFTVETKDQG